MWWKIALAVVAVWLLFGFLVALVKGVAALAVVALLVIGAVTLYRWATRPSDADATTGDTIV
jgi:membrane-bound ClpP family serine protease